MRFGNRNSGLGSLSFRAWQRWLRDRPIVRSALDVPAKAASTIATGIATFAAQSPVKLFVSEQTAALVGNMTYFGENVAQKAGDIGSMGVVAAGIALGVGAWKAIDRYRHRNDPPEVDPAERLEQVEKSATKANEQATRANTRIGVLNNRFGNLETAVQQLQANRTDPQVEQRLSTLESANQQQQQTIQQQQQVIQQLQVERQQDRAMVQQQQAMIQQLVSHAQNSDQQHQQLREQLQTVGQQASTADARAVLAQAKYATCRLTSCFRMAASTR
ncbi:hypothetical protein [Fodinicola acaciae]|uniref:hypothetical protein n=1 Tax=Fodinicola acaciae TaxID=2681555 RepID=UPI0013D38EB1|nr:hypothetical protein [Fodinicola acaciae]